METKTGQTSQGSKFKRGNWGKPQPDLAFWSSIIRFRATLLMKQKKCMYTTMTRLSLSTI